MEGSLMNLGLLILRLVVGLLFVGHGAQKLFGWFGGHGIEGTGGFFEGLGLRPGRAHALAAGLAEAAGGLLLALGLITPVASAALIGVMTVAVLTAHLPKGLWVTNGGYEYNLVLAAVAFALSSIGAGAWSVDHALTLSDHGVLWGIGALAVGLLGGIGMVLGWGEYQLRGRTSAAPRRPGTA
jgi:putative oxidoreductase